MNDRKRRGPARRCRAARLERLEDRALLTSLPFGADTEDTGEFMLGSVLVTAVFMESVGTVNTSTQDASSEDWTPALIAETKQRISEGLQWWVDTLAAQGSVHELEFQVDWTYADDPVETLYEPIRRTSNAYLDWTDDFLNEVGFNRTGDAREDIWDFNHAQRVQFGTNWAFTIFVVNSTNDLDDSFASGGDFQRAFAFAGGRFIVYPSGRPASTVAHEVGHMFWALDEYPFSASWLEKRGYYNTQNLNAYDNNPNRPSRQNSIMANDQMLDAAYAAHTSPASTLAMIGWQDSDSDGIFDVLDVPHTLSGVGWWDEATSRYRFQGRSAVQTLPNQNPSGNGNDITLNKIGRAEYRVDGGPWQTAATYDAYEVTLDLQIGPLGGGTHTIDIRTVDPATGVSSPVFQGTTARPLAMAVAGINGGVWDDLDGNGQWDNGEPGMAGATVRLVDSSQQVLNLQTAVEPDAYPSDFQLLNQVVPGVTLSAIGSGVANNSVTSRVGTTTSTGNRVFGHFRSGNLVSTEWTPVSRRLRIDLADPATTLSIDAVGIDGNDFGRLEVYDAAGNLLERYTTRALAAGQVETMTLRRDTAEIAYAIANAHNISAIRLDNLRIGPQSVAVTDQRGMYALPGLDAGTYTVQVTGPARWSATAPGSAEQTVSLQAGQARAAVDFGGQVMVSLWQNPDNRFDVNDDELEAPVDALQIINDLNTLGSRLLPTSFEMSDPPPPYLDVSGDGMVAPNDVLAVINRLNGASGEGAGEYVGNGQVPPKVASASTSSALADEAPPAVSPGNEPWLEPAGPLPLARWEALLDEIARDVAGRRNVGGRGRR